MQGSSLLPSHFLMTDAHLIDIFLKALDAPHGIEVETSDPTRLRQEFYNLRKKIPDLQSIMARTPPSNGDSKVWFIRKPAPKDLTVEDLDL